MPSPLTVPRTRLNLLCLPHVDLLWLWLSIANWTFTQLNKLRHGMVADEGQASTVAREKRMLASKSHSSCGAELGQTSLRLLHSTLHHLASIDLCQSQGMTASSFVRNGTTMFLSRLSISLLSTLMHLLVHPRNCCFLLVLFFLFTFCHAHQTQRTEITMASTSTRCKRMAMIP